jgi:predicted ATP-dependent endonuclease of OLD family
MLIQEVAIKNFRAIKNGILECNKQTTLIGRNGAGKSTFLQAISCFYDLAGLNLNEEDFFNRDTSQTIEIRITFVNLKSKEKEEFEKYITDDKLIVTKKIIFAERPIQKYYASELQLPEFIEVRKTEDNTERRNKHNELANSGRFPGLSTVKKFSEVEDKQKEYESNHKTELKPFENEVQFIGPKNVGGGRLDKFTKFVLIPAVKEVNEELQGKKSVIEKLIDVIVLKKINLRPEIQAFKQRFEAEAKQVYGIEKLTELPQLGKSITDLLRTYVPDSELKLNWRSEIEVPEVLPPQPIATMIEDEFEGAIKNKGHGLQRALIITLLHYIAILEQETGNAADFDLILAIEEPELYLHPARSRYLASVFNTMVCNGKIQILLTSHSPHFVDLGNFDSVRIIKKANTETEAIKHTTAMKYSSAEAIKVLEQAWEKPSGSFTQASFTARLNDCMSILSNEGFFAKVVVVVEGLGDLGILWQMQFVMKKDWLAKGITVIPGMGKTKIDKPIIVFRGFNIPTYFIFDGDKNNNKPEDKACNKALLRLAGENPVDYPPTNIKPTWACFENNIEDEIKKVLNNEYASFVELASKETTDNPLKNIDGASKFI